jgi:hypothetical protein
LSCVRRVLGIMLIRHPRHAHEASPADSACCHSTGHGDQLVVVRAEWNAWRTAHARVSDLVAIHWSQAADVPRPILHATVSCRSLIVGDQLHHCDHTTEHLLTVCILKCQTAPCIFQELAELADSAKTRPALEVIATATAARDRLEAAAACGWRRTDVFRRTALGTLATAAGVACVRIVIRGRRLRTLGTSAPETVAASAVAERAMGHCIRSENIFARALMHRFRAAAKRHDGNGGRNVQTTHVRRCDNRQRFGCSDRSAPAIARTGQTADDRAH